MRLTALFIALFLSTHHGIFSIYRLLCGRYVRLRPAADAVSAFKRLTSVVRAELNLVI